MAAGESVKLRRIGLAMELEDGSTVMVYADQGLEDAQVTITTETPAAGPWEDRPWRVPVGPPRTSILIEGLGPYMIRMGAIPARELESLAAAAVEEVV